MFAQHLAFALAATLFVAVAPAFAEEEPKTISAETARDYEGQKVSVTFEVRASKNAKHDGKPLAYFDSEYDFHDEKNLGVAVHATALEELKKQGIEFATTHFMKKKVRFVGTIRIQEDRPYLDVHHASQIEVVAEPAKAAAPVESKPATEAK